MQAGEPFGGHTLIIDSSAWIKLPRASSQVKAEFRRALEGEQIRGSAIMQFEILYGGENATEVEQEQKLLEELKILPVTATICNAAKAALLELARQGSPGNHKIPPGDLLIAATAADAGFGVLHHDHHFDKLSSVLAFDSVWLDAPGAL